MGSIPEMHKDVNEALAEGGLSYSGKTNVRHPLDILMNDVGLDAILQKQKRNLNGLKIAPYYGCQIVRPYTDFDDPMYPTKMDTLLKALGAQVVDYPLKTRCCGGSLMGTIEEIGLRLNYILLKEAVERGANCIAVLCPLCQFNLECYQEEINNRYNTKFSIPIVYFTQAMGMALGLSKENLGLQRAIVPIGSLYQ